MPRGVRVRDTEGLQTAAREGTSTPGWVLRALQRRRMGGQAMGFLTVFLKEVRDRVGEIVGCNLGLRSLVREFCVYVGGVEWGRVMSSVVGGGESC